MLDNQRSILSVQILRALAAMMIVLEHALHELDVGLKHAVLWQGRFPLEAGVDLFFVISGFVMVISTQSSQGRPDAYLPFMRRRLARIWPLYAVTTLAFVLISWLLKARIGDADTIILLLKSLTFFPFLRPDGQMQPLFGLGWSLNYEIMFYALFALVLPFRAPLAHWCLIALLALIVISGYVADPGSAHWFWSRPIILEFALGMAVATAWTSGWRPSRQAGLALMVAGAVALLLLHAQGNALTRLITSGLPMVFLLAGSLAFADGDHSLSRLFARVGDASYALYLLHPFVLKGLLFLAGAKLMLLSPWLYLFVAITLSILVSLTVWRFFERPVTRALQGPPLPK